jgi:hyaluronan synthase
MRDAGRVVAVAALVATVALVVGFHVAHAQALQLNAAVAFYVACAGILIWFLALASRREPWRDFEPAAGRVVAIVPAYNEYPAALKACLDALLSGSYVPDSVHVVDDGSDPPLEPYRHGLVTWHRHQQNQGKRWAQLNAVRDETDADFVVTLDSDSVPHKHALRECLRALSDPEIQAAFAVYRASIIRENLVDYVLSGTAGDDRRLTEYALLRGRVVGCSAAWVQTDMPETFIQTFRQRVRWYKSYFLYLRWELVHLSGWPFRLRVWSLAMTLLFPILLAWALIVVPLSAGTLYWQPFAYWVALMYGQTAGYAANRPGMHVVSRTAAWLLLTPLLIPRSLILVKPALYRAIPAARDFSWQTR